MSESAPPDDWQWDPTLYSGSAAYYVSGRVAYPSEIAERLVAELGLDGTGRLLDIGCGPGSLTLLLAPLFEHVTAVDADPDMLAEGRKRAATAGVDNVDWVALRAEALPAELGEYRMITIAQAFHWMDRAPVAAALHGMLSTDGAVVHIAATTHEGLDDDAELPHPRPPRKQLAELVRRYLGSDRRAGQGLLATNRSGEDEIYRAAGFVGPTRIEIADRVIDRTADDIVASIFSLSSAAPHLFGKRKDEFEAEMRHLLNVTAPDGVFSEHFRNIAVDIWRPGTTMPGPEGSRPGHRRSN